MSVSVHEVEPVCKSCAQLYSQTIIPVRKKWRYTQADDSVIDEGVSDEWYSSKECTREECRYRQGAQCQLQNDSVRCPTFQCRSGVCCPGAHHAHVPKRLCTYDMRHQISGIWLAKAYSSRNGFKSSQFIHCKRLFECPQYRCTLLLRFSELSVWPANYQTVGENRHRSMITVLGHDMPVKAHSPHSRLITDVLLILLQ